MIRIEPERKALSSLDSAPTGDLMMRCHLHECIFNSPDVFFTEIGQRLFLIGKDVEPANAMPIRIDLLALDEAGQAVLIAVQRGTEQTSLLRAITCAGLIASWKPADFFDRLSEAQVGELRSFLEVSAEEINQGQRTILVGERFDFEVLAATKWLWERSRMDNTCVRVSLSIDPQTGAEYLGCTDLSADRTMSPVAGGNGACDVLPPGRDLRARRSAPNSPQPALPVSTDPTVMSR